MEIPIWEKIIIQTFLPAFIVEWCSEEDRREFLGVLSYFLADTRVLYIPGAELSNVSPSIANLYLSNTPLESAIRTGDLEIVEIYVCTLAKMLERDPTLTVFRLVNLGTIEEALRDVPDPYKRSDMESLLQETLSLVLI